MSNLLRISISTILGISIAVLGNHQYQAQDVAYDVPAELTIKWSTQVIQNENWKFEVGILNKSYMPYEIIWFKLSVENISGTTQYRPFMIPGGPNLAISIFRRDGVQLYRPTIRTCYGIELRPMDPGVRLWQYLELYPYDNFPQKLMFLNPGEYYVEISFEAFPNEDISEGMHTLGTIRLPITVTRPNGVDAEAYAMFRKFLKTAEDNAITKLPILLKILSDYPTTTYAKVVYEIMLFHSRRVTHLPKPPQLEMLLRKQYFTKYPDSPCNPIWNIKYLVNSTDSTEMRNLYCKIRDEPNASVSINCLREYYPWVLQDLKH